MKNMKNSVLGIMFLSVIGCYAGQAPMPQQVVLFALVAQPINEQFVVEEKPVYQKNTSKKREQKKQKSPKQRNNKIMQPRRGY